MNQTKFITDDKTESTNEIWQKVTNLAESNKSAETTGKSPVKILQKLMNCSGPTNTSPPTKPKLPSLTYSLQE